MTLDYFSLNNPLARYRSRISFAARKKIYNLFIQSAEPNIRSKILDIGVTPDDSLIDSNFFEKLYPWKENITCTSIEDASSSISKISDKIKFIRTLPGEKLPFADNEFEFVFCSAVVEHVGDEDKQREFIHEAVRVARAFFFTTPNRWFPVEFHTILPLLHWLPRNHHQRLLKMLGYDFLSKTENLNLLDEKAFKSLFPKNTELKAHHIKLLGLKSNVLIYGICKD